jgi:hypothetical protein
MKSYYHLHPLIKSDNDFVDMKVDDDINLYIFQITTGNTKSTKKLVKRELLVFRCYQVDLKEIKCPLSWWEKHEAMFPTIGFLVW